MTNDGKKGISVRVSPELHAEVSRYLQEHGLTMSEFVSQALVNELHPKIEEGGKNMANTRTIAFQVPEDLYQRIKDYLQRNNLTQRQFLIDLIEDELELEQTELEGQAEDESEAVSSEFEDEAEYGEDTEFVESDAVSGDDEDDDEDFSDCEPDENESEDEGQGFTMGM